MKGRVMPVISLRNLKAFVAVAEEKSFTKAAERLSQTQPALSKQIKVLEEYLDIKLFSRNEREVVLSEGGAYFLTEARKILQIMESAQEVLREMKGLGRGTLLVGASSLPGDYILPGLLGGFHRRFPGLDIELRISDTAAVINEVKQGKVQLGFIGAEPEDDSLICQEAFQDELILLAPVDCHNSWQEETLIIREYGSGTRKIIEKYLQQNQGLLAGRKVMELGSNRAIINAIKAGLGVGFVPRRLAEESLQLGSVKEILLGKGPVLRSIYLIRSRNRSLGLTAQAFLKYLAEREESLISGQEEAEEQP